MWSVGRNITRELMIIYRDEWMWCQWLVMRGATKKDKRFGDHTCLVHFSSLFESLFWFCFGISSFLFLFIILLLMLIIFEWWWWWFSSSGLNELKGRELLWCVYSNLVQFSFTTRLIPDDCDDGIQGWLPLTPDSSTSFHLFPSSSSSHPISQQVVLDLIINNTADSTKSRPIIIWQ